MKALFALSIAVLSPPAFAGDCEPMSPQAHQACMNAAASEAALNSTYQQILKMYDKQAKVDPSRLQLKNALVEAQKHWVKFREADCKAVELSYAGGTGQLAFGVECRTDHAKSRTKELEDQFLPQR
jgi:uncharacterized protein YecT (DUF1311 family)